MASDSLEPYWKRWRARAASETRQYWTPVRITATIAAPIITGILWGLFKPWTGWKPIMQVTVISSLGFLALWGIVFLVCLFIAPGKLDHDREQDAKEKDQRIGELNRLLESPRLSPLEKKQLETVTGIMADFTSEELELVKYVLEHGQLYDHQLENAFPNFPRLRTFLGRCQQRTLMRTVNTHGQMLAFKISDPLEKSVEGYFHPE